MFYKNIGRDRTRTCNPQLRKLMPYPLGHTAGRCEGSAASWGDYTTGLASRSETPGPRQSSIYQPRPDQHTTHNRANDECLCFLNFYGIFTCICMQF